MSRLNSKSFCVVTPGTIATTCYGMQDLVVAQHKGGPRKQHFIRDVANPDSMQYSKLLGLGSNGKPWQRHDVRMAYRSASVCVYVTCFLLSPAVCSLVWCCTSRHLEIACTVTMPCAALLVVILSLGAMQTTCRVAEV